MSDVNTQPADSIAVGTPIGSVSLDIDYEIIEHFSNHLYGSPNKAIEELVTNGFDAFATQVQVFLPEKYSPQKVIVWDNGTSMDVEGLKDLWKIANSPKQDVTNRIARGPNGEHRKLIGKFGIGKLASYTVGSTITHLCRVNEQYLAVGIDYEEVTKSLGKENAGEKEEKKSYQSNIYQLTEAQALTYIKSQFEKLPSSFDSFFKEESWTFAIISGLKNPDDLYSNRLRWVLGNGMPLRPDFQVWVDSDPVTSKLEKEGELRKWHLGSEEVVSAVQKSWNDAKKTGLVNGELEFSKEEGLDPKNPAEKVAYIDFPNLGKVWGEVKLYESSLERFRSAEQGRSHGFFILVRGRLINFEDDKLFLNEPSFGTFYRSQYVLHVDKLDEDLLADRERLKRDTPRVKELSILQKAIYGLTRVTQQALDDEKASTASPAHRLPIYSREYFIEPLTALWMNQGPEGELEFDLQNPAIVRKPLGEDNPIAELSKDGTGFSINSNHPFYRSLETEFGSGKTGRSVLRELEQLAIAEQLFIGYLYEIGISDEKVGAISEFRDHQLRLIADGNKTSLTTLASNLEGASFKSGAIFENAIAEVLKKMGFLAERDGRSNEKDILLLAPAGPDSYTLIFEAKGKNKGAVANDEAEVADAERHRKKAGAEHVVIVARKFAGFDRREEPAILGNCLSYEEKTVSIMEVEALIKMMFVMNKYFYPLDSVKDVFTAVETPMEKLSRVEKLDRPLEFFDYRALLDDIWRRQGEKTKGRDVAYLDIFYEIYDGVIEMDELTQKLSALQALAYPLLQLDTNRERVALRQSPENIASLIMRKLE